MALEAMQWAAVRASSSLADSYVHDTHTYTITHTIIHTESQQGKSAAARSGLMFMFAPSKVPYLHLYLVELTLQMVPCLHMLKQCFLEQQLPAVRLGSGVLQVPCKALPLARQCGTLLSLAQDCLKQCVRKLRTQRRHTHGDMIGLTWADVHGRRQVIRALHQASGNARACIHKCVKICVKVHAYLCDLAVREQPLSALVTVHESYVR